MNSEHEKKLVRDTVKSLQDYWNTYPNQEHYEDYTPNIIIEDALYGLGIALNKEEYSYAQGFDKFKKLLKEHLNA